MVGGFLAVDWGTTNRRIYHIDDRGIIATVRDELGARAMQQRDYPAEVRTIRKHFGDMLVLIAGMAGSSIGWRDVPYVALPASTSSLAGALHWIDERTAIVPGIAQLNPPDVMRGEEVQLLGATAAGPVPPGALLCQPGTHCKWARLKDASIVHFSTAMTGELFELLRTYSILSPQLRGDASDSPAFREGVRRGAEGGFQVELFGIRARALCGRDKDATSFGSGLLIGDDVRRRIDAEPIYVVADDKLGSLYCKAIRLLGGTAELIDSHAAFAAGIAQIWEESGCNRKRME
jgi:2-dehydro-3-deoxygalactonokinase